VTEEAAESSLSAFRKAVEVIAEALRGLAQVAMNVSNAFESLIRRLWESVSPEEAPNTDEEVGTWGTAFAATWQAGVQRWTHLYGLGRMPTKAAEKRAVQLLRSYLSPVQRHQLRYQKKFGLIGGNGGKYVIHRDGSVHSLSGRMFVTFCFQSEDPFLPAGDILLGKVIWIEANERLFRRIAPMSRYYISDDFDDDWDVVNVRKLRDTVDRLCAEVIAEGKVRAA